MNIKINVEKNNNNVEIKDNSSKDEKSSLTNWHNLQYNYTYTLFLPRGKRIMSKIRTIMNSEFKKNNKNNSKFQEDNLIVYIKGFDNYKEEELIKCYSEMESIYLELAELGLSSDLKDTLEYETWLSGEWFF